MFSAKEPWRVYQGGFHNRMVHCNSEEVQRSIALISKDELNIELHEYHAGVKDIWSCWTRNLTMNKNY